MNPPVQPSTVNRQHFDKLSDRSQPSTVNRQPSPNLVKGGNTTEKAVKTDPVIYHALLTMIL
ncbi:hypothetical protein H6G33_05095 [Calothrix sp. FACHB-1219]|uniref:hypothetical protein n=1 Tax=unclassified Calothrix TaxID=2619626 RepID=UPI001687B099|nr:MULTISPECIES: hypothetical protein [unclassified Calothrix]MBD2203301.1 hypothetical protein [Calothrix sp. FACHB-168]MBD2216403.1 hypothetical protein [Calothrix sp. FACHB-1219]